MIADNIENECATWLLNRQAAAQNLGDLTRAFMSVSSRSIPGHSFAGGVATGYQSPIVGECSHLVAEPHNNANGNRGIRVAGNTRQPE